MQHILLECKVNARKLIWKKAKELRPGTRLALPGYPMPIAGLAAYWDRCPRAPRRGHKSGTDGPKRNNRYHIRHWSHTPTWKMEASGQQERDDVDRKEEAR